MALGHQRKRSSHVWIRAIFVGVWAFGLSWLVMAAMPLWVPEGAGRINHLAFPIFFYPLIWAILFFYAVLDRSLMRIGFIFTLITVINLVLLRHFLFG